MHAPVPHHFPANSAGARYFIIFAGSICAALGLLALFGWHMHLPVLIQMLPGLAPMQYNTALCLIVAGSALATLVWGRAPLAVTIMGAAIAAAGALTLSE